MPVDLPEDTVQVQGGTDFTVALTSTGQVWTWGGNRYGQLGDGSGGPRLIPRQIRLPGRARAASMSVGPDHVIVVSRHGGSVFAWGHNSHGQLGDGSTIDRREPVLVSAGEIAHVATGVASSQALTSSGALLSWGRPITAGSSSGVGGGDQATPGSLALPPGVKAMMVDSGERHLVVLTTGGQLLTFGVDPAGKPLPATLPTDPSWGRVTSISAGDNHTVALTHTGKVLSWGANYYGQLGTHDLTNRATPVLIGIPRLRGRVVQVVAGGDSVVARSSDHQVHTWGQGRFGQLGNGGTADQPRPHPVRLAPHTCVTAVGTGRYHSVVLTAPHHR